MAGEGPASGFTEAALELVLSPLSVSLFVVAVEVVARLLVRLGVPTRGGIADGEALLKFCACCAEMRADFLGGIVVSMGWFCACQIDK